MGTSFCVSANVQQSLLVTHNVMSAKNSYLNPFSEERRDKLDILSIGALAFASVQAGVLHASMLKRMELKPVNLL